MTASNYLWMQPALGLFELESLSWHESLAVVSACVLVVLLMAYCRSERWQRVILGRPRWVNLRNFSRLLHRVHDRREELFREHSPRVWPGAARARYVESVRERLRDCDLFHRDSSCPVIGIDAKDGNHG